MSAFSEETHARAIVRDVLAEIASSTATHGTQYDRPLGFGDPEEKPLGTHVYPAVTEFTAAAELERIFKADVDARSRSKGDGTLTWWHILREEVFEAAAVSDPAKLRAELIQVAAMAVKAIQALEHQQERKDP